MYKTTKLTEYNKDGFHASHINESRLSIVPLFPKKLDKSDKEDLIHLNIITKNNFDEVAKRNFISSLNSDQLKQLKDLYNGLEERSGFITLYKKQLKEIYNLIGNLIK